MIDRQGGVPGVVRGGAAGDGGTGSTRTTIGDVLFGTKSE